MLFASTNLSKKLEPIKSIRGMHDILPHECLYWADLEALLRQTVTQYGYQEIRFPLLERTELFKRSVGEITDIVEKEMYTFEDRNKDNLSLRPEGTAGCARACIEHGLIYKQTQRLWYLGPMYRRERPQKDRYRQFHQFSVEAFGMSEPDIDAELIFITQRLWCLLGVEKHVVLHINSLGSALTRIHYRQQLVDYFSKYNDQLDEESQQRLLRNPLRILDSKNPEMQSLIANAPSLLATLDADSEKHFLNLQNLLRAAKINFVINPRLVRGLDYYDKTVFEWVIKDNTDAQNTVCAGGRYDHLVEQLGGAPTAAIGFSIGLERLMHLMEQFVIKKKKSPHVYLITCGTSAKQHGLLLAEQLRNHLPDLILIVDCLGGSIKNQFKRANKSAAFIALIIGDTEIKSGIIAMKYLREEKPQETLAMPQLVERIRDILL